MYRVKWKVPFVSLRTGTAYTVNVMDDGYSGEAIVLNGGAEPFVTQEDDDEDVFKPVRTQTGYLRVLDVDRDRSAGGFDWTELMAVTGTSRPVTVTHAEGGATVVDWQGFLQAQSFGGTLYGNPQVREVPVQCGIGVLSGMSIDSSVTEIKNFAYLIASIIGSVDTSATTSEPSERVTFDTFSFQGGEDARLWLLTRVDYMNFMHEVDDAIVPKYNAMEVLEDICKFWGWTCRTEGRRVIFSCMDDSAEQDWVTFTKAQMLALTGDTVADSTLTTATVTLSGDVFASTNNEETMLMGVKRAVVKVDVNAEDTTIEFAPADLRSYMGEPTVWVQDPDEDLVGYFKTASTYTQLRGQSMDADAWGSGIGGFERRVIYGSADTEDGQAVDVILIKRDYVEVSGHGTPIVSIETKRAMALGGGSLGFKASLLNGAKTLDVTDRKAGLWVRIGIGLTRGTAKWFYLYSSDDTLTVPIYSGWNTDGNNEVLLNVSGGNLNGVKVVSIFGAMASFVCTYPKIPVADGLYGYLYFDILGGAEMEQPYEIADLEVTFTREQTVLPTTGQEVRSRTIKQELRTSREYAASNDSAVEEKWNADCIFATDNGLEYGHGLIIAENGDFVRTVRYGGTSSNQQHPEQHLANRVARFGRKARRVLDMELRRGAGNVNAITGMVKVSMDGGTYFTVAAGRNWRDDVVMVKMVEDG